MSAAPLRRWEIWYLNDRYIGALRARSGVEAGVKATRAIKEDVLPYMVLRQASGGEATASM